MAHKKPPAVFYIKPRAEQIQFQKLDTIINAKFDEEFKSEFGIVLPCKENPGNRKNL